MPPGGTDSPVVAVDARRTHLGLLDRLDDRVLEALLSGVQLLVGLAGAHERRERLAKSAALGCAHRPHDRADDERQHEGAGEPEDERLHQRLASSRGLPGSNPNAVITGSLPAIMPSSTKRSWCTTFSGRPSRSN